MQTEVLYGPAYALARVALAPNESIRAEAGAMVGMSADIEIQTSASGGFLKALKRSTLGGESFFVNTYSASAAGGEVTLAPSLPGDILVLDLRDEVFKVQAGGYLASGLGIELDTKWGGARSFFGGDAGFFMLNCQGTGPLILASYGALHKIHIDEGRRYSVDTGHVVAFSDGMPFQVRRVGGLKSTLFSGEGFVVDLGGPGDLYIQTRSQPALIAFLSRFFGTTQSS